MARQEGSREGAHGREQHERRGKLGGYAVAAALGLAALAAVLIAFVVDPGGDGGAGQPAAQGGGGGHVHGLGINPADGALFVASHNGLFRAGPGESEARLVGRSGKDIMGFSIVGPNRFLGSGHPGAGEDRPPNLGLILSTDGGRTFESISLLGEADFHLLRAAGDRVYGFDSSNGRFLASREGGGAGLSYHSRRARLSIWPSTQATPSASSPRPRRGSPPRATPVEAGGASASRSPSSPGRLPSASTASTSRDRSP